MRKHVTNILVTGPPGCGKSTLIIRIAGKLTVRARGFTTAEIRSPDGIRKGFRITTIDGAEGILSHKDLREGPRVGRYRVNLKDLDSIGTTEIEEALDDPLTALIVVDEIARMELSSRNFKGVVTRALDSQKLLLGTIQLRRSPFLDAVREREDTVVVTIERGRLDEAERQVMSFLVKRLGTEHPS